MMRIAVALLFSWIVTTFYSSENTLQVIVDAFHEQKAAMIVGSYRMCDFELNTLPPGLISHNEWTEDNGCNNAPTY